MNADGSGVTRLTEHPLGDWDSGLVSRWTANSVFLYRDGDSDIYVMNADGSGVRQLTDNPGRDGSPAWSPGGQQIAFSSSRDGGLEYIRHERRRIGGEAVDRQSRAGWDFRLVTSVAWS